MSYCCEGLLIDYLLMEEGFVYVGETGARIPVGAYVRYGWVLGGVDVLWAEHGVVGGFLGDLGTEGKLAELAELRESDSQGKEQYE